MMGKAMLVMNPPYKLHDERTVCLPLLVERLGQHDSAND